MPSVLEPCRYRIAAEDRIVSVNEAWLDFAAMNGAPHLTLATVLGRPVWQFVTGSTTLALYRQLFAELRDSRDEVVLPFRCDSPDTERQMELVCRPMAHSAIELEGRLVAQKLRTTAPPRSARPPGTLRACPSCKRFRGRAEWLEARILIVRESLFTRNTSPALEEQLCEDCARLAAPP